MPDWFDDSAYTLISAQGLCSSGSNRITVVPIICAHWIEARFSEDALRCLNVDVLTAGLRATLLGFPFALNSRRLRGACGFLEGGRSCPTVDGEVYVWTPHTLFPAHPLLPPPLASLLLLPLLTKFALNLDLLCFYDEWIWLLKLYNKKIVEAGDSQEVTCARRCL